MSRGRISIRITGDKINLDFEEFEGDACNAEAMLLQAALSSVGVKLNVEHSDFERETEVIQVDQREKI